MASENHLRDWLRDAVAMEKDAQEMLEKQASRLQSYPDLRERIARHIEESKVQGERLRTCLDRRGESESSVKTAIGSLMGSIGSIGQVFSEDEVVKNVISCYAFEHFEIACYRSLVAAAELDGDLETLEACTTNLKEEEAMASWLEAQVPRITREFLERELAGAQSKR